MSLRPILIIEPDEPLQDALRDSVQSCGEFKPITVSSFEAATDAIAIPDARFDAIIIDFDTPSSLDFCRDLRRGGTAYPIFALSTSDAAEDIVHSLESGLNDYIIKPHRQAELCARLRAQLRLFDQSENAVFCLGRFTFRPSEKLLISPAGRIHLTRKETEILRFLYRHPNVVVTREALLVGVWGYQNGIDTHTLETHVYRLRQKIEADPANARLLTTAIGGYQINLTG
jgi:DNA-binding response OmpR family regulator